MCCLGTRSEPPKISRSPPPSVLPPSLQCEVDPLVLVELVAGVWGRGKCRNPPNKPPPLSLRVPSRLLSLGNFFGPLYFGSPGTPPPPAGGTPDSPWVGPGRTPPGLKKQPGPLPPLPEPPTDPSSPSELRPTPPSAGDPQIIHSRSASSTLPPLLTRRGLAEATAERREEALQGQLQQLRAAEAAAARIELAGGVPAGGGAFFS